MLKITTSTLRRLVIILGVPVDELTLHETLQRINEMISVGRLTARTHQVVTINADFIVNALFDKEVRSILQNADLATADGMPVVWASRLLGGNLRERVTGVDLVPMLADQAFHNGHSIFLLGGAPGVAAEAAMILQQQYPGLLIAGVLAPPFTSMSKMDDSIVEKIKAAKPDILLVALGNPKQEKWISLHCRNLGVPVAIGVGGTLDFITGRTRRAPYWMQQIGLEWLHRLLHNPRRLTRRYIKDFFVFWPLFLFQWWMLRSRGKLSMPIFNKPYMLGEYAILKIRGSLVNKNLKLFEDQMRLLLDKTPYAILDLENIEFLDSYAIGSLVFFTQLARQNGGNLYLMSLPKVFFQVLRFLKLNQFLANIKDIGQLVQVKLPIDVPVITKML